MAMRGECREVRKVLVIAAGHCVVDRLQKSWIVMCSICFVTARCRAVEATSKFSVMTDETVEICHGWTVSCVEPEKQLAGKQSVSSCIPDW